MRSTSSGLQTADAAITAEPGYFCGITVTPAAADTTVIIYDSENSTTSGKTVLDKILVKASSSSMHVHYDQPITANRGIYATLTGAGAEYTVHYFRS